MNYPKRKTLSRMQAFALTATLVIHLVLVYLLSTQSRPHQSPSVIESTIQYLIIAPAAAPAVRITLPDVNIYTQLPINTLAPIDKIQLDEGMPGVDVPTADIYQFPDKGASKFQHLFDPRLRNRLQNLKHFTKSKTRSVDGVQVLDLGDGNCEFTTVGTSKTGRMSESVVVKCGNNESEQMVENMEKALKDPFGLR